MPVGKLGQPHPTNAFLIPRWGGIVVRDPPQSERLDLDDLHPIMEIFLAQLRALLGVKETRISNTGAWLVSLFCAKSLLRSQSDSFGDVLVGRNKHHVRTRTEGRHHGVGT